MNAIDKALERAQINLTVLAGRVAESPQTLSNWRARGRVPADKVLKLARASGLPPHEIRPDIYPEPEAVSPVSEVLETWPAGRG